MIRLDSVDGFVAFDFPDARVSAGGTRYAPDVDESEAAVLARAMTYKLGVLSQRVGGAKGAVRGTPEQHEELMARYCEEIREMVGERRFLTGADLGTSYADFAPLRDPDAEPHVMSSIVAGVPLEDLITGFGVVVGAEAAMGSVDGLSFAIEGFGKVGSGVAREAVRRGARVVGVSTLDGCVRNAQGLDVELLAQLRNVHGDAFVFHAGGETSTEPEMLFETSADVLVPGARTGVIDGRIARQLVTRYIAPAANAPYTRDGLEALRERRITYLPDFVCNAGATIGFVYGGEGPGEVFRMVESTIGRIMGRAAASPQGPYEGACAIAEEYIETWHERPSGPPVVGEITVEV